MAIAEFVLCFDDLPDCEEELAVYRGVLESFGLGGFSAGGGDLGDRQISHRSPVQANSRFTSVMSSFSIAWSFVQSMAGSAPANFW